MSYHLIDVDNVHFSTLKYLDNFENIVKVFLIEKRVIKNPRIRVFDDDIDRLINLSTKGKIERIKHSFKTKNASDKILMYHLGTLTNIEGKNNKFYIHTNDSDFDTLIDYLNLNNIFCKKISSIEEKIKEDNKIKIIKNIWDKYKSEILDLCSKINFKKFSTSHGKVYYSKFFPKLKLEIQKIFTQDKNYIDEYDLIEKEKILSTLSKLNNIKSIKSDFLFID